MSHLEEQRSQDFHKMCKQAERDHESRKLVALIERVKRQLLEQEQMTGIRVESPKPPMAAIGPDELPRMPRRSSF